MSVSKMNNRRRRLSLLSGVSMLLAPVFLAAPTLLATPALAAEECGDPNTNGPASDAFTCTGTYPSVTYSTDGALTLTFGPTTVTTGGVQVTGSGADNVLLNRAATAGIATITNTGGAGVSIVTQTGTAQVDFREGTNAVTGTSNGFLMESAASSSLAVRLRYNGTIAAVAPDGVAVSLTSTHATSGGVSYQHGAGSISGARGIVASSVGSGPVALTLGVAGGDFQLVASNGPAITATSGGNFTLSLAEGDLIAANNANGPVILVTSVADFSTATFNNGGGTFAATDEDPSKVVIQVGGGSGNVVVNNNMANNNNEPGGNLHGRLMLLNTGNVTITQFRPSATGAPAGSGGEWWTKGMNVLGAGTGSATLTTMSTSVLYTSTGGGDTTLDFGGGADQFVHEGNLIANDGGGGASTLTLAGLETWTNDGRVVFGGSLTATDGEANDRISAAGTDYTAELPANFAMDVDFSDGQLTCAAAVTADCLDISGGSVAGSTWVAVKSVGDGAAAGRPIVLVDLGETGVNTGAFYLSNESTNFRRTPGTDTGVLDEGLFIYSLVYGEDLNAHALMASPDGDAADFATFGGIAHAVWDTSTGSWFDRQLELRDAAEAGRSGMSPGAWIRLAGNYADRSTYQDTVAFGVEHRFNNSYSQDTKAVLAGIDLVNASSDTFAVMAGVTAGKLNSKADFEVSPTDVSLEGHSLGGYASLASGGLFVDAIVNSNKLELEYSGVEGLFAADVDVLGYQLETGYRIPFNEGRAFVEPLLTVSRVRAEFEEIDIGGAGFAVEEATSLRGALGARVSGKLDLMDMVGQVAFTGRVWEEFEGENTLRIDSVEQQFVVLDDLTGTIGDVGITIGMGTKDARLSAFFDYGVKFKDGYQSTDASIGFRFGW